LLDVGYSLYAKNDKLLIDTQLTDENKRITTNRTTNNDPMNIAMLGSGFIGRFYAGSIQGYRNKDKVVSIYSRKEESANKFAADY
jgi:ornithine cyclodeaminase/alanine dehydrogenase-like protein (mu-crystallin family)